MDKTILIQPESGLNFDWKAISINPSAHHEPQIDLVAYKALYINKIAQARACGQEPILVSLPIMDENRYFAYITRGMSMQERKNILYWLGGKTERLRNIHALYNLALFRLAATQCVHIIDITSPMLATAHYCELLEQDGVTLSAEGEALVNDELIKSRVHEAAA
ncbi:MAG: hypothetical protein II605_00585 [Paludibacteraceae bacterium]|nr:hypothetical protein [Paludibacteraceae bacterium]MBQ2521028.1 hypothetical protein [Paludibacteraceae bacterium]MBQ4017718.1 hypothetical protein [Paludibacteraceae bacterium]MBQ5378917.1 hypothetical protein [Paludibacteraceae bacterium]